METGVEGPGEAGLHLHQFQLLQDPAREGRILRCGGRWHNREGSRCHGRGAHRARLLEKISPLHRAFSFRCFRHPEIRLPEAEPRATETGANGLDGNPGELGNLQEAVTLPVLQGHRAALCVGQECQRLLNHPALLPVVQRLE